jgi:hypothetical protein
MESGDASYNYELNHPLIPGYIIFSKVTKKGSLTVEDKSY